MSQQFPTVRMTHPKVEDAADVPESAVPFHERAGWKLATPAAKTPARESAQDKPAAKAPAKNDKEGDG